MIDQLTMVFAALSGVLVGFTLGLVGGGGSILAVPLMVYLVGVKSPHVAIGTSALAVAVNALAGLASHAREKNVNWRCGTFFAATGVIGALAGSTLGKAFDGHKLLFLFALLMLAVAVMMWRGRGNVGVEGAACNRENLPRVLTYGFGTGTLSGFFGIGGGFLIVPALVASTEMPIGRAIGTSLVAVSAFGLATSLNYAASGLVDWPIAGLFVVGGAAGSLAGTVASRRLAAHKGWLNVLFAGLIVVVALYMLVESWAVLSS